MKYRGYFIDFEEAPKFIEKDRVVNGRGHLVYRATCDLGVAYALFPGLAEADLHSVIDDYLDACRSKQ